MRPIDIDKPRDVLNHANRMRSIGRNPTYVILGKSGPTGKSRLTEALKNDGHTAVEISPLINPFISYEVLGNDNFMIEYGDTVVVVLNKLISRS